MSKSTAKAIVTPAGIMPLDYLLRRHARRNCNTPAA